MADMLKISDSSIGTTALSTPVFDSIARLAMEDVMGISLVDEKNSFQCKIIDNHLKIIMNVKVDYKLEVTKTCEKLQQTIYNQIFNMTNIKCNDINIRVSGFNI